MTTPIPYGNGVQSGYEGLSRYASREKADVNSRRPAESMESFRRRTEVSAWGIAAQRMQEEVTEEDWAEHRRLQSQVGVDRGLTSAESRKAYQEHVMQNRFGACETNGGNTGVVVPGQGANISRVYLSQLPDAPPIPHLKTTGASGDG